MVADKTFSILDHTEKLTPTKEKGRYHCPVCGGHNLSINKDGAYQCWNGCECKDIREALAPLSEVADRQSDYLRPSQRKTSKQKALASAPIPPGDIQLASLPEPAADIPQKQRRHDPLRGEVWVTQYPYSETRWVERTEWLDPTKDKGHAKTIIPYHLNDQGKVVKGKGEHRWPIYRNTEVDEHGAGKWVTWPEGEKCVECSRWLGLVGTTLQGADWNEEAIYRAMLRIKKAGVAGVVYLPDHDDAGRKKAVKVQAAAILAGMPYLIIDPLALWFDMPHSGDIADWVKWGKEQGMNRDDFIRRLEEEIHAAVAARIEEEKLNDPDERLKLELLELLKISDPIRKARRKAEICSYYSLGKAVVEDLLKYLESQTRTAQSRCLGLDELFDLPQTGIDYLIPGMLPVGETVLVVADPKTGKSLLCYDAAFAIATGEDTFLGETTLRGKVLIIQTDESIATAKGRLLKRGFRREDAPNVRFMDSFSITQLASLEKQLEDFRPNLVIIDNLRRINAGREISENSAEFADLIYRVRELLTRYGAAGLLIHHSNKDREAVGVGRVRGSSAIAGAVWGVWQLDHIPKPDPNNKKRLIIDPKDPNRIFSVMARDVEGQRLLIELDPENNHWLNRGEQGESVEQVQEKKTHEARVLELLKPISPTGLEAQEINEALGIGKGIYSVLNRLLGKRLIGSRPSATDRRRTVYFYPQSNDGKTTAPPSPTPCEQIVIESDETYTQQGLQDLSPNLSHPITNPSQDLVLDEPEMAQSPLEQGLLPSITKLDTQQGGGEASTPKAYPVPDKPLQVEERVVINCPGSKRHGKTATIKRLKNWGKTQLADLAVDGEGFKSWEAQLSWLKRLN